LPFPYLATVTAIVVTPTPAQEKSVWQFNQMDIKTVSTFLVFLNSENKACLGTLIHKQWVLTAAHCFLPQGDGSLGKFRKELMESHKAKSFESKMKNLPMLTMQHPNFTWDSAEHDLMLIKLTHPLKLNDQLKLVLLPTTTTDRRLDNCTVFGWGWAWRNINNIKPDVKINHTVFWFPDEYCQDSPIAKMPVKITENMFCAGSSLESIHSCKEIDAVPILCQNQLQGILSWSEGCIMRGDVGYYTKVSRYTDWILKVIHTY
uniref:trypsin n=1 Tax=Sus scrofa TaxID=9823 RepID=A0A4X1THX5_PIG